MSTGAAVGRLVLLLELELEALVRPVHFEEPEQIEEVVDEIEDGRQDEEDVIDEESIAIVERERVRADYSVPTAKCDQYEQAADGVLVERGEVGHAWQALRDYVTKVDRGEQKEAGDCATEMRPVHIEREWYEAKHCDKEYQQVCTLNAHTQNK